MVERSGKSESTYIRELLLRVEKQESQSYNNGYNQGFNHFAVGCPICGKNMIFDVINNQDTGKKILETFGKYMHTECLKTKNEQEKAERDRKYNDWFGWE